MLYKLIISLNKIKTMFILKLSYEKNKHKI